MKETGRVCGGYTSVSWSSPSNEYKPDNDAYVFSVDTQTVYHTHKPSEAVYHYSYKGPWFTGTLGIHGDIMSDKDIGWSTNNDKYYPVRRESQGNSPLTGLKYSSNFTVEELEVFTVKFE